MLSHESDYTHSCATAEWTLSLFHSANEPRIKAVIVTLGNVLVDEMLEKTFLLNKY